MKYLGKDENGDSIWVPDDYVQKTGPLDKKSDALGCIQSQVDAHREHARLHGYQVDFKEDPAVPGFYQCDTSGLSDKQKQRYIKERGLCDNSSRTAGSAVTAWDIDKMAEAIKRRYPK